MSPCFVQTVGGTTAKGICKAEWQAYMKYYLHPLLEQAIQHRIRREANSNARYECGGEMVPFERVVQHWGKQLQAAYRGLRQDKWQCSPGVEKDCYKPTEVPYFVSLDNAGCHSTWVGEAKDGVHLPRQEFPVSLLQMLTIHPKGHDVHQIVEHSIGAIKSHVEKGMARALLQGMPLTTDLMWDLVMEGAQLFTAESWDKNMKRLHHALEIIAADSNEVYEFEYKGKVRKIAGQAGNYAPTIVS